MSSDTNELDELRIKLHKIYGFCNEDACTASCKAVKRKGMKLIKDYVITKVAEARIDERNNCWKDFHKAYNVGDKTSDYIIKEVIKKVHANNRKFRVECYWCGGIMFRYSNKFKVKHILCSCWRDEEKRQDRLKELKGDI